MQVFQAVLNLINNAHDAVEELKERWVRLTIKDLGDRIRFEVKDSGSGISLENKQKILSQFFTTKSRSKGTGLGLSIVQRSVSHHDGSFDIDHTCKNTLFLFELPKRQVKEVG